MQIQTCSPPLLKMSDVALFEAIIEGISNDRFLVFIEQYTHALISPLSPKHLRWCNEFVDERVEAGPSPAVGSAPSSLHQFSQQHFSAFQMYQLMFEARIASVLKKTTDGAVSAEQFFEMCAGILAEKAASRISAELESVELHRGTTDVSGPSVLVVDLCETLLEMVESVSSFQAFAATLEARQRDLIMNSDTDEDDEC